MRIVLDIIILILCASVSSYVRAGCEDDPAWYLFGLNKRGTEKVWHGGPVLSDDSIRGKWYRTVNHGRQYLMRDSRLIPAFGQCNTYWPIYLKGIHPDYNSLTESPVYVTACLRGNIQTCDTTYRIGIRRCGDDVQYKLTPTSRYSAYCFDTSDCTSSPCVNGGTCIERYRGYTCSCPSGYTGKTCELAIDECASSPCQNGALCNDKDNEYTCTCLPGYSGMCCEIDFNECVSNPCTNRATCIDKVNGYQCICKPGYTGTHCKTDIDECASSPCQNGGLCFDGIDGYKCSCVYGYTGQTCETPMLYVMYNNSKENFDNCVSMPCENGGHCENHFDSFACLCDTGYHGHNCQYKSLTLVTIVTTTCGTAVILGLFIFLVVCCKDRTEKRQNDVNQLFRKQLSCWDITTIDNDKDTPQIYSVSNENYRGFDADGCYSPVWTPYVFDKKEAGLTQKKAKVHASVEKKYPEELEEDASKEFDNPLYEDVRLSTHGFADNFLTVSDKSETSLKNETNKNGSPCSEDADVVYAVVNKTASSRGKSSVESIDEQSDTKDAQERSNDPIKVYVNHMNEVELIEHAGITKKTNAPDSSNVARKRADEVDNMSRGIGISNPDDAMPNRNVYFYVYGSKDEELENNEYCYEGLATAEVVEGIDQTYGTRKENMYEVDLTAPDDYGANADYDAYNYDLENVGCEFENPMFDLGEPGFKLIGNSKK